MTVQVSKRLFNTTEYHRMIKANILPEDVLLLIEVAETSAAYDKDVKAPLYAQAAIPEYWILDLAQKQILVYRQPTAQGYQSEQIYVSGQKLAPQAFPDVLLDVNQIL